MANPAINPAFLLSPVENGYVAYDPVGDRLHELNAVGALLAELCDGGRSVDEIRELVGPLMPEGKTAEVDRWINQGMTAGFLVWSYSAAPVHPELSAADLTGLAQRLRSRGKFQTAFLCQKRATDLTPDDPDAWYSLGHIANIARRRDDARAAYEKYLEFKPDDAKVRHLLAALRDSEPPPRAPDECILQIYQTFSSYYESQMREVLHYQAPERVQDLIRSAIGDRKGLVVLDLGCGSGLAGAGLKDRATHLIGVDLSPEMIELARGRNIYDRLDIAEITDWLDRTDICFDLIVACECLNYFGDLRQIVVRAAHRLNPGGVIALTAERGDRYPFHLADSGRYVHHRDHVREISTEAELTIVRLDEGALRVEYGVEVVGLYAVLTKERENTG